MDLGFLIVLFLRVAMATMQSRESLDRVNVNQKLVLHCPIKITPRSGLLQWLFRPTDSGLYKLICMKKPGEIDCVKNNNTEPWLENVQMSNNDVEIEKVTPEHRGKFICKYMDTSNLDKYDIEVDVLTPPDKPKIDSIPTTFIEDHKVTLTCVTYGGNPKPSLKWIWKGFSNELIPKRNILNQTIKQVDTAYGQTTLTLIWMPKSSDDGNSVSCVAENHLAKVFSNWMYLNVNYAPIIYDFPTSPYFVLLGSDLNIECKATRKTTATFQWWSDKDEILSETPQLIIKSISKIHKGAYRCSVTNPFGTNSANVNITVLSSPAIELDKSLTVTEGEVLKSQCQVIPAFANVSWWMNSKCISSTRSVEIALVGVKPVELECRATVLLNKFSGLSKLASSSHPVNVTINYKPRRPSIVINPFSETKLGMDLTITCVTDRFEPGLPKPDYFWHKLNTRWTKNNTNFLSFSSLTYNDSGFYVCTLLNSIGRSHEASYNLVILGKPHLLDTTIPNPLTVKVKEGEPFFMVSHFQAFPLPDVTWFHDDIAIAVNLSGYNVKQKQTSINGFRSVLSVERTMLKPNETYRSMATNIHGTSFHDFNVQIQYHPKQLSDIFLIAVNSSGHYPNGELIQLNCTIFGTPVVSISWFRKLHGDNENAIENSTERYYIIERLSNNIVENIMSIRNFQKEDYGRYLCAARSSEGQLETEYEIRSLSIPDPSHDLILYKQEWNSLSFKWIPGFDGGYPQTFIVSYITDMEKLPTQKRTNKPNVTLSYLLPDTFYTISVSSNNNIGTAMPIQLKVKTEAVNLGEDKIIIVNKEDQTLEITLPLNLSSNIFCLNIEELEGTQDSREGWKLLRRCVKDVYHRISIERPTSRFRVRICIISQPDVCTGPIADSIVSDSPENILSTKLIGTVAASCAVLVILLAILLFFILIRTRKLFPGISDLKDIKRNRKSSRSDITNYISKPLTMICPNKHGMLIDSGGCPLLSTYSCDPVHLSNSPIDIYNVCSAHNIFNEGLYSTLVKSNSINLFQTDASATHLLNDPNFINQQSCCCRNDSQMFKCAMLDSHMIPPPENTTNQEKIFYEVMV